jgi:ecotin
VRRPVPSLPIQVRAMAPRLRSNAASLLRPVLLPCLLGGALGAVLQPALALPRLDLTPYPGPAAGETRWVIQLPGVLTPSTDPRFSTSPSDWRVQLIAGREVEADCNQQAFAGRIRAEKLQAPGLSVYRVSDVGPMATTLMACPPGAPKRRLFVPMGSKPFVVPYEVSRPIVIYAPKDLQVRWRLWKAEKLQRPAEAL